MGSSIESDFDEGFGEPDMVDDFDVDIEADVESENPLDKEPFDAGVDVDEETDPKKYIEQLSGKLGQSLRDYTKNLDQPDFDTEKFAINSVISATNSSEMSEEDQEDIIEKLKSADTETGVNNGSEDVDIDIEGELDMDFDEEPANDLDEAVMFGDDLEFNPNGNRKTVFADPYLGVPNKGKGEVSEESDPCWDGYEQIGMKNKDGKEVPNCVPIDENTSGKLTITEAEYKGEKVKLNKPMRGDVKKYKVYVKNDKGNVVKVNFGDKNMEIKRDDPERRKSFRARHKCDNPGPKWKARYWSCKFWSTTSVSKLLENDVTPNSIPVDKNKHVNESYDVPEVLPGNTTQIRRLRRNQPWRIYREKKVKSPVSDSVFYVDGFDVDNLDNMVSFDYNKERLSAPFNITTVTPNEYRTNMLDNGKVFVINVDNEPTIREL